jgi:signal transduction histidine kinase
MQEFYLAVNWLVTIALLGLGLVALLKGPGLTLNRVFAVFTVTSGIWIMASYISNDIYNSPHTSVIGNYFVFLFSYISGFLLLWFSIVSAQATKAEKRLRKLLIPILLVGATSCTPLVVAGVQRQDQVYAVQFGPLVFLYFIALLLFLVFSMVVLHRGIKRTSGSQRAHLKVLYKSLAISLPILLLTEFILPATTGWFGLTNVGLLIWAVPIFGLYYSVVKLRLFSLRLVIVRSLAYVVTLGIIGTLYGFVSYRISTLIKGVNSRVWQEVLNVVLIVIAINVYPPMIRTFRRLTNKFFYQDAYVSQDFFDHLNKILVSTLDLDKLLNQVSLLICDNLKSGFCVVGLGTGANRPPLIFGTQRRAFTPKDIGAAREITIHYRQSVIVADNLEGPKSTELKAILDRNGIAVLVRLTPDRASGKEGLGYLLLGPKKSGNPYTRQDIRVLDAVANELIIAIQNALHFEEIQNFNQTLQQRVQHATRELQRTNDKLKALDETKDEFITMASHQLRTPLTSVKGYLSMVLEGDVGELNAQQSKLLTQSFASSQRMVYLISDLLNLSRLNTGKFVIEPSPVDLREVVQAEIDQLTETAKAREVTMTYQNPAAFPRLMLDETKIHQVVMNFLDNAIYYTPAGGKIVATLTETPQAVEFMVKDNGIGVPRRMQHKLFTKFYRAQNAQQARPDGTGLGLFMAKKVIVAQGGAIIFESEENKGSTFGFRFSKRGHLAEN